MRAASECPLCGGHGEVVARQRLLRRYDVDYYRCGACDLLFTEPPHWLDEAYAKVISRLDTGAVERNEVSAALTQLVAIAAGLSRRAIGLDYGGGHGVFVRMARDRGMNFRWYDKHAENLFAAGFEGEPLAHHDLVTAFEVFEHFADAGDDVARVFAGRPELVLVGTVLHRGHEDGWWYYMLESGQHVVFYSPTTMRHIAERYGYDAIVGSEHTLFLRRGHPLGFLRRVLLERVIVRSRLATSATRLPAGMARRLAGFRSLSQTDHALLSESER